MKSVLIGEYGAVTYYGVDLDSLALIARFAQRPAGRAQAMTAIRYLWTDIAANWWTPGDFPEFGGDHDLAARFLVKDEEHERERRDEFGLPVLSSDPVERLVHLAIEIELNDDERAAHARDGAQAGRIHVGSTRLGGARRCARRSTTTPASL